MKTVKHSLLKQIFFIIGMSAILILAFGIVTALIPNPWYLRMIPAVNLDYIYLITISILLGSYASLFIFKQNSKKKQEDGKMLGWTGGILGFFSFACPICNALLVTIFGSGFLLTYFEPLRQYLGVFAISILIIAIIMKVQKNKGCKICLKN